jgi:hypothetical protein
MKPFNCPPFMVVITAMGDFTGIDFTGIEFLSLGDGAVYSRNKPI